MQLRMSNIINFSGCLMYPKKFQETNYEKKNLCFPNGPSLKIKQNGVFLLTKIDKKVILFSLKMTFIVIPGHCPYFLDKTLS